MAAYIPYVTLEQIAKDAQDQVNAQIQVSKTTLTNAITQLDQLVVDDTIRKRILQNHAKYPEFNAAGNVTFQQLSGKGHKEESEIGAIFAKYYNLSLFMAYMGDPAKYQAKLGQVNGVVNADAEKTRLVQSAREVDEILKDIGKAKEIPEVNAMPVFKSLLINAEQDCMKIKSKIFETIEKKQNPSKVVTYPDLSESFQGREVSYQIEPSGVQGAGKETRFLFQDFLRSRGVDEDSD